MENKAWLKHYDRGVPATLTPYPDATLLDLISETAKERPEHTALIFKGTQISYSQLEKLSDSMAAALVQLGVKKGDRVALLLPNCPQFIISQIGIWKAGAISVPISPLYSKVELEHALVECGAEIAIVQTSLYIKVKSLQPGTVLRLVIVTNIKEYLPPLLRLLFTLLKERKGGHRVNLLSGDRWLQDLLREHAISRCPDVKVQPDDPALILFTGGTTGIPKGAIGSHRAILTSGIQAHAWFSVILKDWDDIITQVMPMFHVYGNIGSFAIAIVGHSPIALVPDPRDLNDLLATIRKVHPAFLPAVPTLFIALLNHPAVRSRKIDFHSIKLCIAGAAPLLAETKKQFETLTGGRMIEGYGLTESMMAAVLCPIYGKYKVGSVGLPITDVEVCIADAETGKQILPPGEVGEILIRAPQLMLGYWQQPAETAKVIRDGWLFTGDFGYLDEDGYLFIVDRKKDLIKISGWQVWPREVEEVIASHPAVAEVVAAGIQDAYQGETLKVWVVLREGQQCTAEEISTYCREKLAPYKVPKNVEFRESLPKTMVGKVLRRALIEEHKQKQGQFK
jgi:long-chain acyl-CoA synthetase